MPGLCSLGLVKNYDSRTTSCQPPPRLALDAFHGLLDPSGRGAEKRHLRPSHRSALERYQNGVVVDSGGAVKERRPVTIAVPASQTRAPRGPAGARSSGLPKPITAHGCSPSASSSSSCPTSTGPTATRGRDGCSSSTSSERPCASRASGPCATTGAGLARGGLIDPRELGPSAISLGGGALLLRAVGLPSYVLSSVAGLARGSEGMFVVTPQSEGGCGHLP